MEITGLSIRGTEISGDLPELDQTLVKLRSLGKDCLAIHEELEGDIYVRFRRAIRTMVALEKLEQVINRLASLMEVKLCDDRKVLRECVGLTRKLFRTEPLQAMGQLMDVEKALEEAGRGGGGLDPML